MQAQSRIKIVLHTCLTHRKTPTHTPLPVLYYILNTRVQCHNPVPSSEVKDATSEHVQSELVTKSTVQLCGWIGSRTLRSLSCQHGRSGLLPTDQLLKAQEHWKQKALS